MTRRWRLASEAPAVGEARRLVEDLLAEDEPELVATASLLVSELATNAICHAGTDFDLEVDLVSPYVRIEVRDTGPGAPVLQTPTLRDPSGRGLQIVDLLADEWGVVDGPGQGKAIWFTLGRDGTGPARRADRDDARGGA